MSGHLFLGDNFKILQSFSNESIDLIYLDPPFFTNQTWAGKTASFEDRWTSLSEYLQWLKVRIQEMHRVLKPTGSLYLHCSHIADAYIRVHVLDPVFKPSNYRNTITWQRTTKSKHTAGDFGTVSDTLFLYTKSSCFTMHKQYIGLREDQLRRDYRNIELGTGRRFNHSGMLLPGNAPKTLYFPDRDLTLTAPDGKRFRWNQTTLDEHYRRNPLCIFWNSRGVPRCKIYADEHPGIPVSDIWTDIKSLSVSQTLYPTQKPDALLERIIAASSNPGDMVLDPFCGSGTTIVAAQRLGRIGIGIDENPQAISIAQKRNHTT